MKPSTFLFLAASATAGALPAAALAQTSTTTTVITLEQIDPNALAGGYRASKFIGATVVNGDGEAVGTVDDLIIGPAGNVPFAVLSVGGFLGLGDTLVVVPASSFERKGDQLLLRGATKDNLKRLPPFTYSQ
ncbi:PRC-barrel domain-containing protein [Gellertiella hungarica]|uniref:Sporulation protein YlmC with PRC-barrel domain n=1 Tax=Gellertiella hungarica TaxID=1572859 RepID=A0A7W6J174_9HYPH|nr:PRC-barrel domain-containing protein [Gellertiella hungarica]MBB4062894.1 sporulation protein YlmC with PRC-barrel domain [Gellertiella hungarica]